jgi:predicted metal-dependent phosphoesterase TrpH
MKADLHCHSVLSDGAMTVDGIMQFASRIDLDCISITDHISAHSIPAARKLGEELGIEVIPGAEITANHKETDINVHLLCYYPVNTRRLQRKMDQILPCRQKRSSILIRC